MQNHPGHQRRRHRPALALLAVVGALICLGMAWWQWDRYESASGTAQNLGYALQWPVFAGAMVWAYRRFVVLEADPEQAQAQATTRGGRTAIPEGVLPERPSAADLSVAAVSADEPDPQLAEYNRYLAELDAAKKRPAGPPDRRPDTPGTSPEKKDVS